MITGGDPVLTRASVAGEAIELNREHRFLLIQ
jgi:hypothetical protein